MDVRTDDLDLVTHPRDDRTLSPIMLDECEPERQQPWDPRKEPTCLPRILSGCRSRDCGTRRRHKAERGLSVPNFSVSKAHQTPLCKQSRVSSSETSKGRAGSTAGGLPSREAFSGLFSQLTVFLNAMEGKSPS